MYYKVYDSNHGARVELGRFNSLKEAEAFKELAEKRIESTYAFLGRVSTHVITIEEGS